MKLPLYDDNDHTSILSFINDCYKYAILDLTANGAVLHLGFHEECLDMGRQLKTEVAA
jgi:hypothetical protein